MEYGECLWRVGRGKRQGEWSRRAGSGPGHMEGKGREGKGRKEGYAVL
jgi:hypothetical protein